MARITLVKGIPFYGFHVGYRYYLKIYMLNPMVMTRLADLLRQGVVMKKVFQPFEAHLQYLLQWMADYNLYGCGYIDCNKVVFRSPVPKYEDVANLSHLWHDRSIPDQLVTDQDELQRVSHCSIEIDICVQDILNRNDIKVRPLHHDFIEKLNPLAPDEKLVHSMAGLWRDETRRRKSRMSNPDPGSSPFPAEVMISMSADSRNSQRGGWIHEEEYREKIKSLILEEKNKSDGTKISFKSFVRAAPFESMVKTCLEAIEDLYPENLRPVLGLTPGTGANYDTDDNNEREVDEKRILGLSSDDDGHSLYDSDEEVMREMELSHRKVGDHVEEKHLEPKPNGKAEQNINLEGGIVSGSNLQGSNSDEDGCSNDQARSLGEATAMMTEIPPGTRNRSLAEAEPELLNTSLVRILKRSESPVKHPNMYTKRQRVSVSDTSIPDVENRLESMSRIRGSSETGRVAHPSQTTSQIESDARYESPGPKGKQATVNEISASAVNSLTRKSSQDLLRAGERSQMQTQPLNFPVVKDPNDPHTILRLSQRSETQPISSETKKNVSFDLSIPFQHGNPTIPVPRSPDYSSNAIELTAPVSDVLKTMQHRYKLPNDGIVLALCTAPPSFESVTSTMLQFNVPQVIYQNAYYSREADVPERAREWAGREFKLESLTIPYLPEFDPAGTSAASSGERPAVIADKVKEEKVYTSRRRACSLLSWELVDPPPTYLEVEKWMRDEDAQRLANAARYIRPMPTNTKPRTSGKLSQIDGPTQKDKHGFKYTQNQAGMSIQHEVQYMSTMSLEIHINTRGSFVPNPEEDEIQCLFWCLQSDEDGLDSNGIAEGTHLGIVVLSEDGAMTQNVSRHAAVEIQEESSELDLMIRMVEIVRNHDPDILTGYEVHGGSWGFLIERARLKYDYNLCDEFSRMKAQSHGRFGKDNDKWGFNNTSTIRVTGRHMINIWRAMRSELTLLQYTIENVAFHLLHRRVPHFTWADLTKWYTSGNQRDLAKIINYYVSRVQLDLEILEKNELLSRTSEQARLLGVDFFAVFSRGSQFKVESLMFRIAKPENFLLVSPSRKQVGGQNALECLPLVMEPQSAFYNSPLLVLDFQSLYPSVMIAYNYCYSTFLGRVVNWRGINKMGFAEYKRQQRLLELLKDHINIAPNGIMYTKPEIRKSLLAKMLGEILETRVMVKSGMKIDKEDKALQRLLNNRQLALKLIANVTYGYTSASFSGRMPCSEIADSIVQTGRETLEKAIALIHSVKRWGAEVVYGDTDSLFVYLRGRSKDQAFDIGEEIAKTVTNMNPRPVKLKFEKVYFPCVLLAKKRYVGFKYESRNQVEPDFDAKGIETVRRDGTPAEQKIEEKALKILFRTADLSQVKSYFQEQCEKIMRGSVSVQDFCFAREVKLGAYSNKGPPPPGALISTKRILEDARAEPQYGERVPYVVITGAPGARLIDRCVPPEELLESGHSELDAEYYISKNLIPPLERIFSLVGANVRNWYDEMPKVQRIRNIDANLQLQGQSKENTNGKKTLESYMKSSSCLVCRDKLESENPICPGCLVDKPASLLSLRMRMNKVERKSLDLQRICQSCSGISPLDEVRCDSKDCPVFYTRTRQKARLKTEKAIIEPVMRELAGNVITLEDLEW